MSDIYRMVKKDLYQRFFPDDAYWIFSEFKIARRNPDFNDSIMSCVDVAIEKLRMQRKLRLI